MSHTFTWFSVMLGFCQCILSFSTVHKCLHKKCHSLEGLPHTASKLSLREHSHHTIGVHSDVSKSLLKSLYFHKITGFRERVSRNRQSSQESKVTGSMTAKGGESKVPFLRMLQNVTARHTSSWLRNNQLYYWAALNLEKTVSSWVWPLLYQSLPNSVWMWCEMDWQHISALNG